MARDVRWRVQEKVQVHGGQWCVWVVLRANSLVWAESVQELDRIWVKNLHDGECSIDSGVLCVCGGDAVCMVIDVDKVWAVEVWCGVFVYVQEGEEDGVEFGDLWGGWESQLIKDAVLIKNEIIEVFIISNPFIKIVNQKLKIPTIHIPHLLLPIPHDNLASLPITTHSRPVIPAHGH